ncbi:hypothetical protein JD793_002684 [Citrobacter braakii]|nr:hypothetical protein [Citrobacter braakii]
MKLKMLVLILLFLDFTSVIAEENKIVGCFSSGKINLKFVQIAQDGVSLGYVKYSKSKTAIPLIFISDSSEKNEAGGPNEYTSKWAEFINGKVNGHYIVMTQGARFYQFEYISSKNITTEFKENINAYNADSTDCKW